MPKLMSWQKDNFTGDIYDFTLSSGNNPDPNSSIRNYTFLRPGRFSATSDGMGRMLVYFSADYADLRIYMQIKNFRDASGKEIYKDGVWLMTEFEPVLNMFDKVHAYRTRLALNVTGK